MRGLHNLPLISQLCKSILLRLYVLLVIVFMEEGGNAYRGILYTCIIIVTEGLIHRIEIFFKKNG